MKKTVIKKQLDDAVKTYVVKYDKYEDFYVYSPGLFFAPSLMPYIYAFKDTNIYKLKFIATYRSRKRMYPNKVILNFDGTNLVYKPFSGDDVLVNYDTGERRVTAWVNLTDKDVYTLVNAVKGNNVSFAIKDSESSKSAEGIVYPADKERVKSGFWVYVSLRDKKLERGQNRF